MAYDANSRREHEHDPEINANWLMAIASGLDTDPSITEEDALPDYGDDCTPEELVEMYKAQSVRERKYGRERFKPKEKPVEDLGLIGNLERDLEGLPVSVVGHVGDGHGFYPDGKRVDTSVEMLDFMGPNGEKYFSVSSGKENTSIYVNTRYGSDLEIRQAFNKVEGRFRYADIHEVDLGGPKND